MDDATSSEEHSHSEKLPESESSASESTHKPTDRKSVENPATSDFVAIVDSSGEMMELPTAKNVLFMTTLQASFPGATGLKYKNPKTGASRAVQVDPSGSKLLPPTDGWDGKIFNAIVPRVDVSAKRRKVDSDNNESDSEGENGGRSGRKRAVQLKLEPEARRPTDLIVLGIPYKTTDDTFKQYFESFGNVIFAEVKRNSDGSSKGFGFVRMSTIEEQDRVLINPQHTLDGRRCDVRIPDQRQFQFEPTQHKGPRTPISKLFVGKLSASINESKLTSFFTSEAKRLNDQANVMDVYIPKPFRSFAFVTFNIPDVADRLSKITNLVIEGSPVVLSLAVPKNEMSRDRDRKTSSRYADYDYGNRVPDRHQNYFQSSSYRSESRSTSNYDYPQPVDQRGSSRNGWYRSTVSPAPVSTITATTSQRPQPLMSIRHNSPPLGAPSLTNLMAPMGLSVQPPTHAMANVGVRYGNPTPLMQHPQQALPPPQTFSSPPPPPSNYVTGTPGFTMAVYPTKESSQSLLYGQTANIASGLDALDLNPKPELLSAAWNAFFSTLSNPQGQSRPLPGPWK
ncbi:unnamed protein product [Caenorhabditis auriculariae]|uniref:RRM domain-containing protein n=1 Tax=Caenorhabditis auriculariae TaxID=2777116 RepID=A0A8S1HQY3_9PELO|nr:unnamed protein product [Caenorhabditis auriculariae]